MTEPPNCTKTNPQAVSIKWAEDSSDCASAAVQNERVWKAQVVQPVLRHLQSPTHCQVQHEYTLLFAALKKMAREEEFVQFHKVLFRFSLVTNKVTLRRQLTRVSPD